MPLLLLNEDELRQVVTISEAIEAVEAAFAALAEGRLHLPGEFALNLPQVKGEIRVKGTYLDQTPYYVVKVRSNFRQNPMRNLSSHSGLTAVVDVATGIPAAIMLDNGYLSTIRSGAAGAVAAKYLANEQIDQVAVIGSGDQAYIQLKALMKTRNIGTVTAWASSPANADYFARRLVEDHDLDIQITSSLETAVRSADLIVTATRSERPLIEADWLKVGVHLTVIGGKRPTQQLLQLDVLRRADVIITDQYSQAAVTGEIYHGLEAGVISKADVQGELGDLIIGKIPGRTHPDQISLADLTGLDVQDTALATLALEKARFLGLGQQVEN